MRLINHGTLLEILILLLIDLFSPLTERWMKSPLSLKNKYDVEETNDDDAFKKLP